MYHKVPKLSHTRVSQIHSSSIMSTEAISTFWILNFHLNLYILKSMHTHTHTHTHTRTHTHTHIRKTYIQDIHVHTTIYIYTYIHTNTCNNNYSHPHTYMTPDNPNRDSMEKGSVSDTLITEPKPAVVNKQLNLAGMLRDKETTFGTLMISSLPTFATGNCSSKSCTSDAINTMVLKPFILWFSSRSSCQGSRFCVH